MQYTIKKTILGKLRVYFVCMQCKNELNSPLEEAGEEFPCPLCGMKYETPGKAELLRQRAIEEQQRIKQEEDRRRREIAATAAAQLTESQRAAAVERREQEQREAADHQRQLESQRERERIINADRMTASDRLLTTAFKFAKGFSVIVIIGCFATIGVCAVMALTVHADKVTNNIQPFVVPTVADYQDFMKLSSQSSGASSTDQDSNTNQIGGPQAGTLDTHFDRLLQHWGLSSSGRELDFIRMDSGEQQILVDDLEQFMNSQQNISQESGQAAMAWYIDTFKAKWEEHADAEREAKLEQDAADSAASLRRQQLLIAIGGALAALLAFLFLPLMIQVEQNTRRTLELHAALNKGMFSRKGGEK